MLAMLEQWLLIPHPNIAKNSWGMVAEGRVDIAIGTGAVEVHTAVEFQKNVFC